MRTYECIYILNPALDEQTVKDKAVRYAEIVTSRQGSIQTLDQWGKRRLAFPIKKQREGYYTFLRFGGTNEILKELNRVFGFDEAVLRHMIVVEERPRRAEQADAPAEGR